MTKRKRDDDDTAGDGNTEAPNFRKQRQIVGAFSLSAQRLEKAFKLGKGFERQKLGRRKKTAAKEKSGEEKERELKRIDAEIAAVKVRTSEDPREEDRKKKPPPLPHVTWMPVADQHALQDRH
jgi:hypothetical protein